MLKNITDKIYRTTGKDEVAEQVVKAKKSKAATTEGMVKNILPAKKMPVIKN